MKINVYYSEYQAFDLCRRVHRQKSDLEETCKWRQIRRKKRFKMDHYYYYSISDLGVMPFSEIHQWDGAAVS